jgi:hypothetical protein
MAIKGTMMGLEKRYLRLTSAPDPATVRPEPVLKMALAMVEGKWAKSGEEKCNYGYACEQLKSIRQDLTVQCIKNGFTVEVYEKHARIALESGDFNEFNQCQTQLIDLYAIRVDTSNSLEFLTYRILYYLYVMGKARKDEGNFDLNSVLHETETPDARAHVGVQHALKVRSAMGLGHYNQFFKLHAIAGGASFQGANKYFTAAMLEGQRDKGMKMILKS